MMAVIIVSGTPGTGKTYLAKRLAKSLGFKYTDVKRVISKNKLKERYDRKRRTYVVDEKKLAKILEKMIRDSDENLVIESHMSHFVDPELVDLCIITKCELKTLEKRLKNKGYNKEKVRENLDCEIFDICLNEAKENGHKTKIVDTTKNINIAELKRIIR